MARQDKISVLFVCMGNICRSPTAEAVFREQVKVANLIDKLNIDSAGTHAYHVGEPPDSRAQEAAEATAAAARIAASGSKTGLEALEGEGPAEDGEAPAAEAEAETTETAATTAE